MLSMRYFLLLF